MEHRKRLANREEEATQQMARAYSVAMVPVLRKLKQLEAMIAEAQANGEDPDQVLLMVHNQTRQNLQTLKDGLKKWSMQSVGAISEGQKDSALMANDQKKIVDLIQGAPPAGVVVAWNPVSEESIQALVGYAGNGSPLQDLFDGIYQAQENAIIDTLVAGTAAGIGPEALARAMYHRVADPTNLPMSRAKVIARTEMMRASRAANQMLFEQNPGIIGYRRMAVQDLRACPACVALSGTFHKVGEIMPTHPQCRCTQVPVTKTWAEITGNKDLPDFNAPPLTGEMIMSGLSIDDQQQILGMERWQMWKNGTPLQNFISIEDNPDWGPTTRTKPIWDTKA